MATKTKESHAHSPAPWNDLSHQADELIAPNAWVEVTKGDHKGKYGVAVGRTATGDAIVRTRDENNELLVVDFDSLANSSEGRRPT